MNPLYTVTLAFLAHTASAALSSTSPTYFPAPSSVKDSAGCQEFYQLSGGSIGSSGPIFTPPGKDTICIYFPSHDVWRHDTGSQGNCRGECCEWFPPRSNDGTEALKTPPPSISWFASLDGTCNGAASGEVSPWIFTRAPPGNYQVCMKPGADRDDLPPAVRSKFHLVPVKTSKCGGEKDACCPFTFPKGYKPPFAKEDDSKTPKNLN